MRLAIVATSSYEQSAQLTVLESARLNLDLMRQRLSEKDTQFVVRPLPADRRLSQRVEQLLATGDKLETLLFYFSGYAVLSEARGPQLLLDGEKMASLSVKRMRKLLSEYAPSSLVILDAVAPLELGCQPTDVVSVVGNTLVADGGTISVLAAARLVNGVDARGPSPLTHLFCQGLDLRRDVTRPLNAEDLYTAIQSEPSFAELPAAGFFKSRNDARVLVAIGEAPPLLPADDELDEPTQPRLRAVAKLSAAAELAPPTAEQVASTLSPTDQVPSASSGSVAEHLALGDARFERARYADALAEYQNAHRLLGADVTLEHVPLFNRIGYTLCALSRDDEALNYLETSLGLDSAQPETLEAAVNAFVAIRELDRAEAWLKHWLAFAPADPRPLKLSNELVLRRERPQALVDARCRVAQLTKDPSERARLLTDAARIAIDLVRDEQRGIDLLRQALSLDPAARGALERLEQHLSAAEDWLTLAQVYAEAILHATDGGVAHELNISLARLYREHLADHERAPQILSRAPRLSAGVDWSQSTDDDALEKARALVLSNEYRSDDYRRIYLFCRNTADLDTAWNAATVLDAAGDADINESLLAATHRPEGLLPARANLTDAQWAAKLLCPERNAGVERVLDTIYDAAVDAGLVAAHKKNRVVELDATFLHDPELSTTTLAKSLLWTSRLLGVTTPKLYVLPEVEGALRPAAAREPTALAARALGSGLSLPELAFLWGRQVAAFRREHYLAILFPTPSELGTLLGAAIALSGFALPSAPAPDQETKKVVGRLKKHLRGPLLERLGHAVAELRIQSPLEAMRSWLASVEMANARAGLLACGDVEIAARLSRRFPSGSELSPEGQATMLMAYCVSREYAELRARLGVRLTQSTLPS